MTEEAPHRRPEDLASTQPEEGDAEPGGGSGGLLGRFRRGRPDSPLRADAPHVPEDSPDDASPDLTSPLDGDESADSDASDVPPRVPDASQPEADREAAEAPEVPEETRPDAGRVEEAASSDEAPEGDDGLEGEDEDEEETAEGRPREAPSAEASPTGVPAVSAALATKALTPDSDLTAPETDPGADIEANAGTDIEGDTKVDIDADIEVAPDLEPIAGPLPDAEVEVEVDVAGEPRVRVRRAGISAHLVVLSTLATVVTLAFLLIEPSPRWLLLLGAAAVVIGLDGTLRHTWRLPFADGAETAPYLFVPALYMLAVPVVIEHNVPGELVLLAGLAASAGFAALAWGETASVRPMSPDYDVGRVLVTAGTYVAGFSIFSLTYVFDVSLPTAVLAVGLASTMLAVEVLREGEIDPQETLGFALVTGVVMAEARLLMYYVPLDTYLAGLTLLLGFYLVTGLLHSHITRAFTWAISVEYGGIAAAGLALVVAARMVGVA